MNSDDISPEFNHRDGRKVFKKLGTCSRTFFYILNREFGNPREVQEKAADPLAGGIMQKGHQCGMLWGSSLAVGAEAYQRCEDTNQAISIAIKATQSVMKSFLENENTINCRDITRCNFSSKLSFAKYLITGRFRYCFKMAEKWAPEAIQSAIDGLTNNSYPPPHAISCASEVAKKMGASDEEMVMVAGFAGGLGLSGSGCGALSAAIWMNTLGWCKEKDENSAFKNPIAEKTLNVFENTVGDEILCNKITQQYFETIHSHSDFIKNGGCADLIKALSLSKYQEEELSNI